MTNIYAGFSWISLRIALHAAVISPGIYVWYQVIDTGWYVLFFVGFLCVVYAALVYNQAKLPLLSVSEDEVIIRDFFWRGKTQLAISEIIRVHAGRYRFSFEAEHKRFAVNLAGMGGRRIKQIRIALTLLSENSGRSLR